MNFKEAFNGIVWTIASFIVMGLFVGGGLFILHATYNEGKEFLLGDFGLGLFLIFLAIILKSMFTLEASRLFYFISIVFMGVIVTGFFISLMKVAKSQNIFSMSFFEIVILVLVCVLARILIDFLFRKHEEVKRKLKLMEPPDYDDDHEGEERI